MNERDYKIIQNLNGKTRRRFGHSYLVQKTDANNEFYVLKVAEGDQIAFLKAESSFSFKHPSLPNVIDFQENEKQALLLLKHKTGVPVLEHSNKLNKKKRIELFLSIAAQALDLLQQLHNERIAHLDIKPSNLIFDSTTNQLSVIDFGMAKKLPLEDNKMIFPMGYAAPELLLNEYSALSLGTDLFALGISLYQIWTGNLPLIHPNPSIMTNLQLAHPLEKPEGCPDYIFDIILGLTQKPLWKTAPNRMHREEVLSILKDSIKKRETFSLSLPEYIQTIRQFNEQSLLVKLFSKPKIKGKD